MAFNRNRNFPSNGRRFNGNNNRGGQGGGQRGSYKGGRSFRDNRNEKNEQNYELRGILWGNKFRDEQKQGAPVLQGYATVHDTKFRVAGFLNVAPDYKDDRAAQKEKEAIAREINNILLDAQDKLGIAFSLVFEVPEEEEQESGGRRSSGASRRNRDEEQEEEEEEVPFNRNRDEEPEPEEEQEEEEEEDEPAPAPRRAAKKATKKAAAKSTRGGKTPSRKGR